ncbi:MAG: bile acid:sodium symporter family protein [Steroidobacteraceae bacterium]|nr:bile acid:sodium symporter family protein [Steroidobacteraceae bacterium]
MTELDAVRLNFSPESLVALNFVLAFVMFGVALDMKWSDFRGITAAPRAVLIGMASQFLLLPAAAWALTMLLRPQPSIALGLILVACCPGGNISNFFTHFARGNTALSVTMTACSTVGALFFTPFNTALWGSLNPATAAILNEIAIDPVEMFVAVAILLVVPAIAGISVARHFPGFAARARKPFRFLSLAVFAAFVVLALAANWDYFLHYTQRVVVAVFLLNALGFVLGYLAAGALGLPQADRRAVSIETGIQNSGLGLILVFNFFGGIGGMAITAAWWGIWHILAGLALATWWRRRTPAATGAAT